MEGERVMAKEGGEEKERGGGEEEAGGKGEKWRARRLVVGGERGMGLRVVGGRKGGGEEG